MPAVGETVRGGIVGLVERLGAFGDERDQLLRVREAPVLALVVLPLLRLEAEGLEVANLVREEVALARGSLLRALARGALLGDAAPGGELRGDLGRQLPGPRERVQERALALALHQQLVVMLAVDVDQELAQFLQLRDRGRPAVHERARSPARVDRAPHEAGAITLLQLLGRRARLARREARPRRNRR
jgi:hypothetical protein